MYKNSFTASQSKGKIIILLTPKFHLS